MAKTRTLRLARHVREFIDFLYVYPNGKRIAEEYLHEQGIIRDDEKLHEAVSVMSDGNSLYEGAPTRYTVTTGA